VNDQLGGKWASGAGQNASTKKCWVALDQLPGLVLNLALPNAGDLNDSQAFESGSGCASGVPFEGMAGGLRLRLRLCD